MDQRREAATISTARREGALTLKEHRAKKKHEKSTTHSVQKLAALRDRF